MKKNIAWLIVIVFIGLISLNLTVAQASGPADYPIIQDATPTPEEPTIGSTRISETDQMAQVYVPAGEFIMGSTDIEAKQTIEGGRAYPEIPQHTVYVDSFWIDKYEVTTSQYAMCVEDGVCDPPFTNKSFTRQEYYGNPEYADYPVIWVKWEMARTYCEWAGRRMPTEAEAEKAARGTDGHKFPWGDEPYSGEYANMCDVNCPKSWANPNWDDGYADTAPVGSYPAGASPYGAMDMVGNVWEWNASIIQPYPYDANDGRENPENPENIQIERSWRSGAWNDGYWWMRASVRYRSVTNYWYYNLGIRCASSE
ncbi:MAG: formylglycine-generating enzyme family protein [Anaerolineales bacterium]|nr:formylglycine-generating enzyme family protein [Anaerolineales bacterium]